MSNVAALVPQEATATRPIAVSSFAISPISHVSVIVTWSRVISLRPFSFPFFFQNVAQSRRKRARSCSWPRSARTSCSPYSACTRFDYRSRFEDRLIASSVDEEAEKEVVGSPASCRPPLQQPRVVSRQDPTRWIPRHGRAGCDWIRPRISRLPWGRNYAFFTHFSVTLTNFSDSRSEFWGHRSRRISMPIC